MKIGIMQPYFLPYIGYWQLLNAVDKYVIYDNIEFTKGSWIRKNRFLLNGKDKIFSIPIKKDSDFLNIDEREISKDFIKERVKILNQIKMAYKKAPEFDRVFPILEEIFLFDKMNLFEFIYNSVNIIKNYLDIKTEIIISSKINIDHSLKGKDKVIAICKELKGIEYYNAIGGQELYSFEEFKQNGIELKFLKADEISYKQFDNEFISNLSILDIMMFNSKEKVKEFLNNYSLMQEKL